MAGKRAEKREALTKGLIDAAENQMATLGLKGLRARDIAQQAGCAVGSVYTVFKDLEELALHVNLRTIARMDNSLDQAGKGAAQPEQQLIAMGEDYHKFALENRYLWFALFDHHLYNESDLPDWYKEKHLDLFRHVEQRLKLLQPQLSEQETRLNARTLFSAVHGIITINLQSRFIAVSEQVLTKQLNDFIKNYVRGIRSE